jgi:hypothetical protein
METQANPIPPAKPTWPRTLTLAVIIVSITIGIIYAVDPGLLGFPRPEDTIHRFVRAYNDKDINLMLSCFDSRIERGFHGVGNILGGLLGVNPKDLFEVIPMLAAILESQPGNSRLENVNIHSRSRSGKSAVVVASLDERVIQRQGQKVFHHRIRFHLQREESEWRIMGMEELR